MKADIKKYVRTNKNEITTLEEYYIKNKIPEDEHYFEVEYLLEFEPIIKVANTPEELIQERDICETKNYVPFYIQEVRKSWFETNVGRVYFHNEEITKILTPNSSGGYDLQYSKEVK